MRPASASQNRIISCAVVVLPAPEVPTSATVLPAGMAKLTSDNARRVWGALEKFGAPLSRLSITDFEKADQVIQIGVAPTRIDLLTSIDGVEFNNAWDDRISVRIDGLVVPTISRHHLIANKRATARPQDLADAERLLELPESSGE